MGGRIGSSDSKGCGGRGDSSDRGDSNNKEEGGDSRKAVVSMGGRGDSSVIDTYVRI